MVRSLEGINWRSSSRYYLLSDQDIEAAIARNSKLLRAVMPDDTTTFSVITISVSDERTSAVINSLTKSLSRLGIKKPCYYRESGSNNLQVFIWWNSSVKATELEEVFSPFLQTLSRTIEIDFNIFPGPRPLILPLQPGFAWIDDTGEIKESREQLFTQEALSTLLQDRSYSASDWEVVRQNILSMSNDIPEPLDYVHVLEETPVPPQSEAKNALSLSHEPETNREVIVNPEEVAACANMQQLSLFSVISFERGPP